MNTATHKDDYRRYADRHQLPVFYQPWFLDVVCGAGTWDASILYQEGEIIAVWPYYLKSKYGIKYITTPTLTAALGPWYEVPSDITKAASVQAYHKKVLTALADELPHAQLVDTRWSTKMDTWMPLSWKGFWQTTRYTYQVDLTRSEEDLLASMTDVQRNTIRKAQKNYKASSSSDIEAFWKLNETSYSRQGEQVPYTKAFFLKLYSALVEQQAVEIKLSSSGDSIVGGVMIIYDQERAYLSATGRSDEDQGGAVSLSIWEAMLAAKGRGQQVFDFEGSMIEGIEAYFRSFGGVLSPYHRVIRTSNKMLDIIFRLLNRY